MGQLQPITFERFLTEDFFSLLGLEDLSEEAKADIIDSLNKTVQARVYATMYERLSVAQREKLDSLPAGEIIPYLQELGFDIPEMVYQESLRYRLEVAKMYETVTAPLQKATVTN